ncbi:unnamed protein product [Rotaria sp. Silwood1]|nr:unnamed protein product [Rotaria sp. Silwood1]CAF0749164.1 unnamed protein product [Rotaria sp. Silwood1]CAF3338014.1 unnamed protein product [Rotaria sp. Silwood1]CAF3361769.1 unnamed protein product [Rotaria sp. Silwood1]CAF4927314.1 unnamed protein product [Rotaria sp. Silwood1]
MLNAETFNLLTRLLNYVFAIPFLILGILGSLLTVIVFTRQRAFRRNTTITYLLAGAIVTGIHLPTIYIQMILVYGFNTSLMNTNVAACREHTYLRYVTTVAAISFPCWASFDQYATTSRKVAFRNRWSSLRVARLVVVCNMLFWILIYIPVLFFTGIRHGVCAFIPSPYTTFNTYVFTPLVYCIGPIAVVTFCTRGTIKNLRSNIIRNTQESLSKQVRSMLLPQLTILAISGIPFGFQGVYLDITSYVEKDAFRIAVENFAGQVILIFYHFNYVFTFYIYVFMSSEIRKILKRQVFKFIGKNRVTPANFTTENSISLRPLNNMNSILKA